MADTIQGLIKEREVVNWVKHLRNKSFVLSRDFDSAIYKADQANEPDLAVKLRELERQVEQVRRELHRLTK